MSHEHAACDDEDCQRYPCRIYRQGRADGFEAGYQAGWADGYARGYRDGYDQGCRDGYRQGFPDGIAACPRPHR